MANKLLSISPSPHIKSPETVTRVMRDVIIALIPAIIMSIVVFKMNAVKVIVTSVVAAIVFEIILSKCFGKKIRVFDLSAIVTGILFAFVIPPTLPLWMVVVGVFVALLFGKMIFGGLGANIFNPALVGRCFLLGSWPVAMTTWLAVDGKTGPTVLNTWKLHGFSHVIALFGNKAIMDINMFLGLRGGSLGETSALAILIGGAYLLWRKQITWHIPTFYIGTVFVLSWMTGRDPIISILSGGLLLGAFFMATDMVTSPNAPLSKFIFAVGAGIFVVWIREKGGYPEGVAYSILLMNAVTPLLDRYIRPKPLGLEVKKNGGK